MKFVSLADDDIRAALHTYLSSFPNSLAEGMKSIVDEKLRSREQNDFKFAYSVLYQAGIFVPKQGYTTFNQMMKLNISEISSTLKSVIDSDLLSNEGLQSTQSILNKLMIHPDHEALDAALQELFLNPHKLLNGECSAIIFNTLLHDKRPLSIAFALIFLKDHGLLNSVNIRLIAEYPLRMLLVRVLREIFQLTIEPRLLQTIFVSAVSSKDLLAFSDKIHFLYANNGINKDSIQNLDSMYRLINELSSFRQKSPSPLPFFASSSPNDSATSCDSVLGSLEELLVLCRKH